MRITLAPACAMSVATSSHRCMKITYLTAGAGGMICGSCLHDNALARALHQRGHDLQLIPVYTPIRTDETDFSTPRVFLGGINIYLHQSPWLRWLPQWATRWLDRPAVLRWATRTRLETSAAKLGELAVSVLQGTDGPQRRDFENLHRWLETEARPDVLVVSNLLISGGIRSLKQHFRVPVVALLQGDDVFLDGLLEPFRAQAFSLLREIVKHIDRFAVHSDFYAQHMSNVLDIPRARIQRVQLGIDSSGTTPVDRSPLKPSKSGRFTVGYLARMAPEKGLHELCAAYVEFRRKSREFLPHARLAVAGWNGPQFAAYVAHSLKKVEEAGLGHELDFRGELTREEKFRFLREEIDLLCVPSPYREPKGIYALEAMASGVPIVAPNHGIFPELIRSSLGGTLFEPKQVPAIADQLLQFAASPDKLRSLALNGQRYVQSEATIEKAAESFERVLAAL